VIFYFLKGRLHLLPAITQTNKQQVQIVTLLLWGTTLGRVQLEYALHDRVQRAQQMGGTTLSSGPGRLLPWGTSKAYYSRGESSSGAECTSSGMSNSSSSSSRIPFYRGCSTAPPSTAAAVLPAPSGEACGVLKSPPHPVMGVPIRTRVSPIAGTGVPLLVHSCMRRSWICLRLS
jgi:hypothetical protein